MCQWTAAGDPDAADFRADSRRHKAQCALQATAERAVDLLRASSLPATHRPRLLQIAPRTRTMMVDWCVEPRRNSQGEALSDS